MPPFTLTAEQRAQIDAVRSNDARVMLLQQFHQVHAFAHRDRSLFGMVADPAVFSRVWMANEAAHMEEAWGDYRAMPQAARATHEPSRKRLGLSVGIAIAALSLAGCDRHIVRDAIAASEQHRSDVFQCRLLIGVDDPFKGSNKRLEMACAHDVMAEGVAKGLKRTAAANIAASQCLPDLAPCARALASGTSAGTAETAGLGAKPAGPARRGRPMTSIYTNETETMARPAESYCLGQAA